MGSRSSPNRLTVSPQPPPPDRLRPSPKFGDSSGPRHPDTLATQLDTTMLLVNLGLSDEAVRMLQQMEPHLLGWIGQELYSTEAGAERRQLVSSQATFQDVVLTLATMQGSGDARRLAGTVMLRFKLLQGEEEAYRARLTRRSQDPGVRRGARPARSTSAAGDRGQAAGARRGQPGLQGPSARLDRQPRRSAGGSAGRRRSGRIPPIPAG